MKIRMKTTMAGPEGCASPGQVIEHAEARALVAGGYAEWVETPVEIVPEKAVVVAPEKAVVAPAEKRGRKRK